MRIRRVYRVVAGAAVTAALVAMGPSAALGAGAGDPGKAGVGGLGHAGAVVRDADGQVVGKVTLRRGGRSGTSVSVRARGLTPGFHGFHVHAIGTCTPPFTSAGGHLNPTDADHGEHVGDMPSLLVQEDGTARLTFETDRFTVRDLFDSDGSAVIIHAGPDNFANIPSRYVSSETGEPGPDEDTLAAGDAGARVACGVVRR